MRRRINVENKQMLLPQKKNELEDEDDDVKDQYKDINNNLIKKSSQIN